MIYILCIIIFRTQRRARWAQGCWDAQQRARRSEQLHRARRLGEGQRHVIGARLMDDGGRLVCSAELVYVDTHAYTRKHEPEAVLWHKHAYIRTLDMQIKQQLTPALDMNATTICNHNKCNDNIQPQHKDLNSVLTRTNAAVPHRLKWAPVNDRQRREPPAKFFWPLSRTWKSTPVDFWGLY